MKIQSKKDEKKSRNAKNCSENDERSAADVAHTADRCANRGQSARESAEGVVFHHFTHPQTAVAGGIDVAGGKFHRTKLSLPVRLEIIPTRISIALSASRRSHISTCECI